MTTVMTGEAESPPVRRGRRGILPKAQGDWTYDLNIKSKSKRLEIGEKIVVVDFDGTKHPELAGRRGFVSYRQKDDTLILEIEGGGGTYKASELWWRRDES